MTSPATDLSQGLDLDVLLRDGSIAQIRLVTGADEAALTALNARVSVRTRQLRYFSTSDRPGAWYVDQVLRSAPSGAALVAVVDQVVVALASFARLERDPETADCALLVDDEHQVHGLGALLLEHLAALARHHGICAFTADVLQENTRMRTLLSRSGFEVTSTTEHGVAELRIELAEVPDLWESILRREAEAEWASLAPLLAPQSVALVGSTREGSVASQVFASLTSGGYTGRLERLNRTASLTALNEAPDLVVVAVPAAKVLEVARDAAARGAKGLAVLSAGFAETGSAGRSQQAELLRICRESGMRLVGPNCLGIVNTDPSVRLNATFCDAQPRAGSTALVSQSGAVGIAALRHAERRGAGLSLFVSTGNKADVSGNDLLAYLQHDPRTSVIALYLESFGNARKFARLARTVGRTKPIVVVKAGRSPAGARAGMSHTAAAATPDVAIDALLLEAGVLRADDLDELFDIVTVLSHGRLPRGRRVAVIGNSGGPGVLAADACERAGLLVADLAPPTSAALAHLVPDGASVSNPVDLLATVASPVFGEALRLVMKDPGVDAVVAIYTPLVRGAEDDYAQELVQAQDELPDVPVIAAFPGVAWAPTGLDRNGRAGVPFFEFPERAVRALGRTASYALQRTALPVPEQTRSTFKASQRARVILQHHDDTSPWLAATEATELLAAYGIACAALVPVIGAEQAAAVADQIGFPVALKASGPTIVHKADIGGVRLDLRTGEQVHRAYLELQSGIGAQMTGAAVQRMQSRTGALELIAGITVDPSVGPLLMVGAGGTLTDLLADRVVRVPPTSRGAAVEQLSALRCSRLFGGYRGLPALDLDAATDVLLALSALARDLPEVQELDINPLLVSGQGAIGVDVRIRIGQPAYHREEPARALKR
ncbi:MAG: CoA-binding domain protein [Frankiales bacterium]|nr:CoA-binding domain protein [Frankiales bacterium]